MHVIKHIELSLDQDSYIIENSLPRMSLASLQQILSNVEATHNETFRLQSLAKLLFFQCVKDITTMHMAMKLCEEAIRSITVVKFYEISMDRHGRMSWEDFKMKIDEVMYKLIVCFQLAVETIPQSDLRDSTDRWKRFLRKCVQRLVE